MSIAGAIASMTGFIFILVLLLSPHKGIIGRFIAQKKRDRQHAVRALCLYLAEREKEGQSVPHIGLAQSLGWSQNYLQAILALACERRMVGVRENAIVLFDRAVTKKLLQ